MDNDLQVRPKPKFGISDDAEDEMLNYQELFHRSNLQPSAQVIREPKIKRQQSNENEEKRKKFSNIDLTQTTVMRPVIIERDVSTTPIQMPKLVNDSFPQAKYRGDEDDLDKITLPNVKKASLFAKQMYRDGKLKTCKELEEKKQTFTNNQQISRSNLLTGTGLGEVTGERELQRIHDENIDRLQSMDEKEILAEKEKLLNTLDPKLIAFIRKRNKDERDEIIRINKQPVVQNMDTDNQTNLPIEIDSRWIHMNNIENEKLEWMKDLPKPSAQRTVDDSNPEGVPARFDFKGNLISRTADIPVTAALHHHGDEPDAAGYTLEELFHLSRSTVLQQRVIALQTLTNIIRQAHTGIYDRDLQLPLIPKLIESGIVFLIRWAMDEQIEVIYMIAIECLSNLIAPQKDEEILSQTLHWPCGYYQPNITPPDIQLGEKKSELDLTDIEILEQDLIKCLFRMNLLKRIVYLFDRMKLLSTSISIQIPLKHSFHILIRMARHSMTCANQIFEERQLMDFIIREFIPEISTSNEEGHVYEHLHPEALKFLRVLANHGSSLSFNLINRYGLNQRLRNHLVTAVNLSSSLEDNRTLGELLSLWRVFILQGYMADEFGSLIPTIILPLCRICIQQMPNTIISQILVQLITLFDSLIIYITKFISKHRNSYENLSNAINWSHIDGLFDVILTIGKQTTIEIDEKIDLEPLRTACLSCLASFLIGQQLLTINLLDLPSKVKLIRNQFFEPILHLKSTKKMVENVKFETAIISTNSSVNLPVLTQTNLSPFGFLIALLRLTKIIYQIDKSLSNSNKFISQLMLTKDSEIVVYIKKILNKLTSPITRKVPWFEQYEHIFLFEFIQVIYQEKSNNDLPSIYYEILLSLLPSLLKGYHYLAQEILKFILFDSSFWKRSNEIDLTDLSLVSNEFLCLASNESLTISSSHRSLLYQRAIEHLPSLFTYYKNLLHINQTLIQLNLCDIHFGNLFQIDDLFKLNIHYTNTFIDITWPYGLLSSFYTNSLSIIDNNKRLDIILNTLRFVYILETKQCLFLNKILTKTTRFSMIAGIYLLGSDVFLEKNIADYLLALLNCFNEQNLLQKLQTKTNIQSLMLFFDFYHFLVEQYEACSFGDILYSNYLLVPLQQIYDVQLRKNVWMEHSIILKYLRLKPDQILFSLETFFIPYENDLDVVRYYAQVLLSGIIKKLIQPFLYMIAIHHLNGFLFDQTRTEQFNIQRTIMKNLQIISINEKILYEDVINYKTFSRDGPVLFTSLPGIRVNWLQRLLE